MQSTTSWRERKKERTREALVEAAFALFAAQGFEATTIDQIVERAGVARRTFFRYFASKEAVAFPDRQARLERFRRLLADCRERSRFASVRGALLDLAGDHAADRRRVLAQQRIVDASPALSVLDRRLDVQWRQAIVEALLAGRRTSRASARRAGVVAAALIGAMRATLEHWYTSGGRGDLVKMGREALDALEAGLSDW